MELEIEGNTDLSVISPDWIIPTSSSERIQIKNRMGKLESHPSR